MLAACGAMSLLALPASAADAPLREDRIRFVVHDLVANQLNAAQLGGYVDKIHTLLHGSQVGVDIPTCTDFGTLTAGGTCTFSVSLTVLLALPRPVPNGSGSQ